ncbi:hypothetical protein ABEO75_24475 [Paenibacillus macerans]|uniref:hypothetical protein n=1 Tax=Paenibacillus macerans TaxID=44252 RepID=UPI002E1BB84A|nr:hypothetical protein [Paenibacillus macerans]
MSRFWEGLAQDGGKTFAVSVDFVGHNFYVDVFDEKPLVANCLILMGKHGEEAFPQKYIPYPQS